MLKDSQIDWIKYAGSNFTSGTLNETWQDFTNANRFVTIGNLASSTDNNFFITGIQLEVGSQATPFEHRSFGEELALCQSYYCQTRWSKLILQLLINGLIKT